MTFFSPQTNMHANLSIGVTECPRSKGRWTNDDDFSILEIAHRQSGRTKNYINNFEH
jgi:hypothetical protein